MLFPPGPEARALPLIIFLRVEQRTRRCADGRKADKVSLYFGRLCLRSIETRRVKYLTITPSRAATPGRGTTEQSKLGPESWSWAEAGVPAKGAAGIRATKSIDEHRFGFESRNSEARIPKGTYSSDECTNLTRELASKAVALFQPRLDKTPSE